MSEEKSLVNRSYVRSAIWKRRRELEAIKELQDMMKRQEEEERKQRRLEEDAQRPVIINNTPQQAQPQPLILHTPYTQQAAAQRLVSDVAQPSAMDRAKESMATLNYMMKAPLFGQGSTKKKK